MGFEDHAPLGSERLPLNVQKAELYTEEQGTAEKESRQHEGAEVTVGAQESRERELRREILEGPESKQEDEVRALRRPRTLPTDPMPMPQADRELVEGMAREGEERLAKNYEPGFGVFPSSDPDENFYQQLWTRDLAHAGGNYLATQNPEALKDSLETIFSHQREDGMLPLRTEKQYMLLKLVPGLRKLAKPVFEFLEGNLRGRSERPVYEGQDFSSAEDTVPAALIAAGEFFIASPDGRKFAEENFVKLEAAVDFFRKKTDPEDGLASAKHMNADWADSITRGGKLGGINVWWVRSLRLMALMASQLGKKEEAAAYRKEFHHAEEGMMGKLYDKDGAYFRTAVGEDRIDAVASIFGSLYFLDPAECVRVQDTFKARMKTASGLKNFDPPYPSSQVMWPHKLIGHQDYHNKDIWPWVTCENIQVKIKIATQHADKAVRNRFKQEAIDDLHDMADLFEKSGGAYEIYHEGDRKPAVKRFYKPPQNLMGNLAAYEGAYLQMKELGWLDEPAKSD